MSVYKNNNKFISYLIILIALFILVLVTKDKIGTLQEKLDLKETYASTLEEKKKTLQELNDKKVELDKSAQNIDKYMVEIKEDELIDYIYSYIEKINDKNWVVVVKSLSISEPKDTEIWFKETDITLNLRVPSDEKTKQILTFLTSTESKYKFFINSFTFPYSNDTEVDKVSDWLNAKEAGYSISIPLKVLHK